LPPLFFFDYLVSVLADSSPVATLVGLLDRSCAIQLAVEAACAGNPSLSKHVISDDEAAYNCRMASEANALYREAQPDLELEMELAGGQDGLAGALDSLVINC
jgi:hypothetical protein